MYVLKCRPLVRLADCTLSLVASLAVIQLWIWVGDPFTTRFGRAAANSSGHKMQEAARNKFARTTRGGLVLHKWEHLCASNMLQLTHSPMFPKYPDATQFVSKTNIRFNSKSYGQRVFGFLRPPETGFYKFILYSDDNSEFWLSSSGNWTDFRLLAHLGSRDRIASAPVGEVRFRSQVSASVFLSVESQYAMEILHYQREENDFVELQWIRPGEHVFEVIKAEYLSYEGTHRPLPRAIHQKVEIRGFNRVLDTKFNLVATLPDSIHGRAVQTCSYNLPPQSLLPGDSEGHSRLTPLQKVFANKGSQKNDRWKGITEAKTVVDLYIKQLNRIYPRRYTPRRLFNLLKFPGEGLFLLELELTTDGLDYTERIVDYVHKTKQKVNETFSRDILCLPKGLQWDDNAVVHLIVVANREIGWIGRLVDRLDEILEDSLEVSLDVVVVHSKKTIGDYNISAAFENTLIASYRVLPLDGKFSRARALNEGVRLVGEEAGGILLTCQANVELPPTIFDDTRKHCIEGQMVYAPVVFDPDCASRLDADDPPPGVWNHDALDILGMYKSDWDRAHGMDESLADRVASWDLVERLSNSGLFIARSEVPSLFHFFQRGATNRDGIPESTHTAGL